MDPVDFGSFQVALHRQGSTRHAPVTYPVRYGTYSEIRTRDYVFQFDLNGDIKYIQGRRDRWPAGDEWLKRTIADDWVFYATSGEYSRLFALLGEYYLPCFTYPTNTIYSRRLRKRGLADALGALAALRGEIRTAVSRVSSGPLHSFLTAVAAADGRARAQRAQRLHALLGARLPVLPPDTRHVDYNVVPLILAEGCLYDCSFCRVKSGGRFRRRGQAEVTAQIRGLAEHFGPELANYNAVFLGQHDALHAGEAAIEHAARLAHEGLGLDRSLLDGRFLFLFASVHSLVHASESLYTMLDRLPYRTYLNVGLESFHQEALQALGKPLQVAEVREAFGRMQDLNRRYANLEVTANLVLGRELPPGHLEAILEQAGRGLDRDCSKGALYLSPMDGPDQARQTMRELFSVKRASRLPTFLYLIQRL
ncbi:MAG: radical SAM protein [Gemmatimonadota bacterium]